MKRFVSIATLFLSLSTLVCCALPALFVMLGAGAAFATLLGIFPHLIWFSEHKGLVFFVAGMLLFANLVWRRFVPPQCPTDPVRAAECARAQRFSGALLTVSLVAYLVGGFFAFVAPLIF
ncbi:MAG: hypothetical protein RL518_151 [Pseudomonadota bacterium]|jgi:hypothetical protein